MAAPSIAAVAQPYGDQGLEAVQVWIEPAPRGGVTILVHYVSPGGGVRRFCMPRDAALALGKQIASGLSATTSPETTIDGRPTE